MIAKSKLKRNRRYYFHSKLKGIYKFNALKRTFFTSTELQLTPKQQSYLNELINDYGYVIQTEIA